MTRKDSANTAVGAGNSVVAPSATSWIQKTPGVCGGDACIRNTPITVWGLLEWRRQGLSDADVLQRLPGLTPADLDVATDYYQNNREEIERAIRGNQDA